MLTVVIPTVASRAESLRRLLGQIDEAWPGARVEVVQHVAGTPPSDDPPRAFRRCELAPGLWVLHVEDDVHLGPLAHEIPSVLEMARADVVNFFSLRESRHRGVYAERASRFSTMVCTALRTAAIRGISDYATRWYLDHPEHHHAADLILRSFMVRMRLRYMVHSPSLVQHRPLPSTLGPRSRRRQSPTYRRAFGDVD